MNQQDNRPLIYIIAGEPSGDALGGRVIAAIKRLTGDSVRFAGVGGEMMQEQGVKSLFPIRDIAIMGFVELIPHLPKVFKRIRQTRNAIAKEKPDLILTIDAPGFSKRVVKDLKGRGIPLVHYVAPTVWAYRPERAKRMAGLYDRLLTLLPFEPPYFRREGLQTDFVGHSVIEEWQPHTGNNHFRHRYGIASDVPLLVVLPGSREGEVERHMEIFGEAVEILSTRYPDMAIVVVATKDLEKRIQMDLHAWHNRAVVVSREEKREVFGAADIALAKSGTVTLELALAGVPMVVGYKVSPFSAWAMRKMIRVRFVSLVNLLMKKEVVPELLQEFCRPELIADELDRLLEAPEERRLQVETSLEAMQQLGLGNKRPPSERVAVELLRMLGFEEDEESDETQSIKDTSDLLAAAFEVV